MTDVFRPHREPARTVYDAFQNEAKKRPLQTSDGWIEAERQVVYQTMCSEAPKFGLPIPTMEEVRQAETYATGHIDYGSKWVYRLLEIMSRRG